LLPRIVIETPGELLLKVLQRGTVSTNIYLITDLQRLAVLSHNRGTVFFVQVLLFPVLADRVRDLGQPGPILGEFQDIHSGKILHAIRLWIAQRLEQPSHDKNRHIMRLAI
jgi:hypothetical protein